MSQARTMVADLTVRVCGSERGASQQVRELERERRSTRVATVCGLVQLLDLRDLNTGCHSTRLAEWAARIGWQLGLDESTAQSVEEAALLHDIGKIGVDDVVLRKVGAFTDDERTLMQRHAEYGWAILRVFPGFEHTAVCVLHHHERYDGTGYPAGLEGRDTPLGARIVAVIDSFDAMISSRPYRKGLPLDEAMRRLERGSGTQFDLAVVERFLEIAAAEAPSVFATVMGDATSLERSHA